MSEELENAPNYQDMFLLTAKIEWEVTIDGEHIGNIFYVGAGMEMYSAATSTEPNVMHEFDLLTKAMDWLKKEHEKT